MSRWDRLNYNPTIERKKLLLNNVTKLIVWVIVNIEVCIFTEEEFMRSMMNDPGFQIKILNIAKKGKVGENTYYRGFSYEY